MTNENKPPMFGTSAMFDPATHEARSGKSALMNTLMEYKRRGATTAVVDKGPSLSLEGEADNGQ